MTKLTSEFPKGFVWGAATSAYQIEGGWDADGKAPSVWDAFCHDTVPSGSTGNIPGQVFTPGNVHMGHSGDVAADHYHRYGRDVELMSELGLMAYRFSISWPRVVTDASGTINTKGLDFYDRLVDALLAKKIEPYATLFHWDLPLWAYQCGGWLNRDVSGWFEKYSQAVVKRLGDRVKNWMTLNEPQIFLGPTEFEGLQTSNARKGHAERLLAAHHAMMSHGRAVQVLRALSSSGTKVGFAPIGRVRVPASGRAEDVAAAKHATWSVLTRDFWNNTWFGDPICLGHYPEDGLRLYGTHAPKPQAGDMELICQKLDFYGMNIYDAEIFRACEPSAGNEFGPSSRVEKVPVLPGHPRTAIGWNLVPEALYYGPKWMHERYKLPIAITENGLSNTDWVSMDGKVHDPQRIDYTRRYLLELKRAIDDGVPVFGYFHWSLLDNMEWQSAYKERFGLIHVDFNTQVRTVKESGKWYKGVIASNGATLRLV
jgi:beta-glucosidase